MVSIIIGGVSILYTNTLVDQLKNREQRLIELYAKSLEYASSERNTANISFHCPGNNHPQQLYSCSDG